MTPTHPTRPQLRGLRRILALALGERFSRVRVTIRRNPGDDGQAELVVRTVGPRHDWWTIYYDRTPAGCRTARRRLARRIHTGDLP